MSNGAFGEALLRGPVRMSLPMYLFYSAALALVLLLSLPYWIVQMLRHGKYRAGLAERLGRIRPGLSKATRLADSNLTSDTIWIHAVSVGEVLAVTGLVAELRRLYPRHRILVSTTTNTGQQLAAERFGADNVFYFPLDFAFAIRPYLEWLRPRVVVLAETEFWPNFLRLAKESGARIAVVNARISNRSWPGYRWARPLLSRALSRIDVFLAQTGTDRDRLLAIGAPPGAVQVAGNLKFDVAPPLSPPIVDSLRAAFARTSAGPILVCGSTVDGEESLLLRAFEIVRGAHPRAVMILAPRHPQRFRQVSDLVTSLGIPCWRRSLWGGEDLGGGVLLLDGIGELASVYSLAHLAFVGGSLVEHGGHNILEPAQWGVPIVVGPHYENFRDIVNLFLAADAIRVVGPAELPLTFLDLLSHEPARAALGCRARETLRGQAGATHKTLAVLENLLQQHDENASAVHSPTTR
jgi:3-deoxy-D-manno-octulosonic-acid transferase